LFSLFFSTSAFAQSKTEADTLYTKEKYEEAANMYEKILATQGEAAEIYYNLGNCYY
jgi:tetratricopeptide (TPR) repeat protein